MAAPSILTDRERRFLQELVRRDVKFMIVGLSAAALQGAPAVTQDIDLWFKDLSDPKLMEALKKVGGVYVSPTGSTPPMFVGQSVALFDIVLTMDGLGDFDEEIENTVDIRIGRVQVKVLRLSRVIVSKRAANRSKDRLILPVLEDAAATLREHDPGS